MSATTHTCISIDCDTPGCDTSAGEDGGIHFPSAAIARASGALDGWHTAPDGVHTCPDCLLAEQCQAHGHRWSDWYPSWSPTGRQQRLCHDCGTREAQPEPDTTPER
ncbi:MAG TPA: hypothetical protein VGN37_11480 [Actinocatenispora sp.]